MEVLEGCGEAWTDWMLAGKHLSSVCAYLGLSGFGCSRSTELSKQVVIIPVTIPQVDV